MRNSLILLLLLQCLLHVNSSAQKVHVPEGWHVVKACGFSFVVPNDVIEKKVQPIDSCVAQFQSKNIAIKIDYGIYRGPATQSKDDRDYKVSDIKVSGKSGKLATYYNDWENPETKHPDKIWYADIDLTPRQIRLANGKATVSLSFSVSRYESADPEVVKMIYESLKYLGR
jgi:hypothetical protein